MHQKGSLLAQRGCQLEESEAAQAYAAVDPAFFVGPARVRRYELLLEQRAYCWLQAGERLGEGLERMGRAIARCC